jgi:hypothetical protein
LELTYSFKNQADYHATGDWNIEYSLDLVTTAEQNIRIFDKALWRR